MPRVGTMPWILHTDSYRTYKQQLVRSSRWWSIARKNLLIVSIDNKPFPVAS